MTSQNEGSANSIAGNPASPEIVLRRSPGTCCPEPSCDYVGRRDRCEMCGKSCENCEVSTR
jgi:hypothetical protein